MDPVNALHVIVGVIFGYFLTRVLIKYLLKRSIKGTLILTVGPYKNRFYNLTEETKMALVLNADQKVKLTITPVDAYGNLSVVENVTWSVSDPEVLMIEELTSTEVYAVAVGPTGDAQVVVTADAKIGEGETVLRGVLDFTVLPAEAVSLSVVAGTPELK